MEWIIWVLLGIVVLVGLFGLLFRGRGQATTTADTAAQLAAYEQQHGASQTVEGAFESEVLQPLDEVAHTLQSEGDKPGVAEKVKARLDSVKTSMRKPDAAGEAKQPEKTVAAAPAVAVAASQAAEPANKPAAAATVAPAAVKSETTAVPVETQPASDGNGKSSLGFKPWGILSALALAGVGYMIHQSSQAGPAEAMGWITWSLLGLAGIFFLFGFAQLARWQTRMGFLTLIAGLMLGLASLFIWQPKWQSLATLEEKLGGYQQKEAGLTEELRQVRTSGEKLRQEEARLKQRIGALSGQFEEQTKQIGQLQASEAGLQARVSEAKAELDELRAAANAKQRKAAALESELQRLQTENRDLRKEQQVSADLAGRLAKLKSANGRLKERMGDLKARTQELKAQVAAGKAKVSAE